MISDAILGDLAGRSDGSAVLVAMFPACNPATLRVYLHHYRRRNGIPARRGPRIKAELTAQIAAAVRSGSTPIALAKQLGLTRQAVDYHIRKAQR